MVRYGNKTRKDNLKSFSETLSESSINKTIDKEFLKTKVATTLVTLKGLLKMYAGDKEKDTYKKIDKLLKEIK